MTMSPRLDFALEVAREAGELTLRYFNQGTAVEYKSDSSPVTEADRQAENLIRRRILKAYPQDAIFGEEEGGDEVADRWLIDPIDGTKSFIAGVPLYATLLSYEVNSIPIVGVAFFPALGEIVYAEQGSGCFYNGQRCHVSQKQDWQNAIICTAGHKSIETHGLTAAVAQLAQQTLATRTWCDAYGHALVATGRADAMIDPILEPYDVSSMSLIVSEAGGACTSLEGKPWPKREGYSSNGILHEGLLEALRA